MREYKIIAVDFDGTLSCEAQWPNIGTPNTALITMLIERKQRGDKLILWTCRQGKLLEEAIQWCKEHGLFFDAINDNLPEVIELYGNNSRKISSDYYIDDKNLFMGGSTYDRNEKKPGSLQDAGRSVFYH